MTCPILGEGYPPDTQFILLCTDPRQIGQDGAVSAGEIDEFKKQQNIEYYRAHSVNKEFQIQGLQGLLVNIIKALNPAAVEQPTPRSCCTIL